MTDRQAEFQDVKNLIKENYKQAMYGIFDTSCLVPDERFEIFHGEYFSVLICYSYEYFEVFGMTDEEFEELKDFYEHIGSDANERL